ncbi:hypothetical protein EGW08_014987 [Elysia chlorotica]|uniref:BHLH domain-containing protein n=1 Tax=Elysia chlorotica TaxID=188477 RepID=A0A433T730_ELYCH|nr:hypothetical protein EGW08_014987 [Elysia chlorotica]
MASENPDHAFRRPSNADKKKRVPKKYVGLNDEEIEKKRLRKNEMERARQHAIQASFSKLDGVIPDHMKIHKDGSRLSTLDNASHCIEQLDRKVNYCYQILRADPKHQRLANFLNEGKFGNGDVGVMVRNIGHGGSQNQAHVEGNQQTNENHDNSFTAMTHASLNHNHSNGLPAKNNAFLNHNHSSGLSAMNHASLNHNLSSGLPVINHTSLNHNLSSGLPVMNHASLNHTNGSLFMSHVNQNIRVDPMISNNQSIVQTFDNYMNPYSGNCLMNHSRGTGFKHQTSYTVTNAASEHTHHSLANSMDQQGHVNIPRNPKRKGEEKENCNSCFPSLQRESKNNTRRVPHKKLRKTPLTTCGMSSNQQQQFNITTISQVNVEQRNINQYNIMSYGKSPQHHQHMSISSIQSQYQGQQMNQGQSLQPYQNLGNNSNYLANSQSPGQMNLGQNAVTNQSTAMSDNQMSQEELDVPIGNGTAYAASFDNLINLPSLSPDSLETPATSSGSQSGSTSSCSIHGNVNVTATLARSYESIDDLPCLSPDTIIRTLGPLVEDTPAVASSVSPSGSLSASSNQDSGFGTPSFVSPDGSSSTLPCLSPDTVRRALGHL